MIAREPLNINSVAGQFAMSRAAIYKHIRILVECSLIVVRQKGRERYCEARLERLSEVAGWVEQYRAIWETRLDSLEDYLKTIQTTEDKHGSTE